MTEEEKLEKSGDYFANPKKDTGKRRGRRPGSKNKKTLEKEREVRERMEQEQMQKSKTEKGYDFDKASDLLMSLYSHRALAEIIATDRTQTLTLLSLKGYSSSDVEKSESKPVAFKGYNGTWKPIAKANHYTMWESVEMGDKAFNIVTVTKKKRETGELIEKIAFEDVDGIEDDKVKGLGLKKYIRGYEEEQNQLELVLYESHDELDRIRDRVYDASTSYFDTTETHQRFDDLFKAIDTAKDVCIREYDNL